MICEYCGRDGNGSICEGCGAPLKTNQELENAIKDLRIELKYVQMQYQNDCAISELYHKLEKGMKYKWKN